MLHAAALMLALLAALGSRSVADTGPAVDGAPAPAPAPAAVDTAESTPRVLKAGTLVLLRMVESVGSDTHQRGQPFPLEVIAPVVVDGATVIPAGTPARGHVIHAARSGMMGKAGELMITSRYLTLGERQVRLKSLLASSGESKADLALGVGLAVPFAPFFIKGRQITVPADTELVARIAADESFPP
ncbi:MAG: hypothetical protein MUF07_13160 [Steroidobacteraceae bacterium]|jgi:hypothetical protein|nr:hypothetical protein [Steroidobacteraceae bacterium]